MTTRLQATIAEAMALIKTADLGAATRAIQRGLSGGRTPDGAPSGMVPGRRLGEVLRSLNTQGGKPCHPFAAQPNVADQEGGPGWRSHRSPAGTLAYKLHVPADTNRDLSLVIMLHGCTQDPDDFARGTGMNRLAEEFGLVVAYPHQPRNANAQGCWNWFDPRHQQAGAGEPAMLAGLARELATEFSIAPRRVFAAGLSAGAAMAEILAQAYPDVFAAVGIHSGLPYRAAHDVMSAFAAMKGQASPRASAASVCRRIIFHGDADATVAASNGDDVFARIEANHRGAAITIVETKIGGRSVTRKLLDSSQGATLAEHWRIHGAGHAWAGGNTSGSFTDAAGPDASREMIRFFLG